jgi:oxygen-dependent protoporphyrinogen oxidase
VSGATAAAAPPRVVIVGAGISGLACAHHLLGLARERGAPIALTLLDGGARPGGVIATERTDGFLLEGGPDCFISDKPWALDLCRRLGMGDQIIGTNPDLRRSFVATRGRVLPIPEGYQLMAPGRLLPFATSPILSPAGRLRAAIDLVLPRGAARDDESLASFVRRRFGREMLEALAQASTTPTRNRSACAPPCRASSNSSNGIAASSSACGGRAGPAAGARAAGAPAGRATRCS